MRPGARPLRPSIAPRDEVAALLGRDPAGIVFVSGATEANHTGIRGIAARGARRFAAAAIEHPSVHGALAGLEVHCLPTRPDGAARLDDLPEDTNVVVLMAVNHETGVVQPIREAARWVRQRARWLHVDATQAAGKLGLRDLDADAVTLSAHKLGGPVGIGALSLRDGDPFPALLGGGSQERGRRAGTVNVVGAVGFAAACRAARLDHDARAARWTLLSEVLASGLGALGARNRRRSADPVHGLRGVPRRPRGHARAGARSRGPRRVVRRGLRERQRGPVAGAGGDGRARAGRRPAGEPRPVHDRRRGGATPRRRQPGSSSIRAAAAWETANLE